MFLLWKNKANHNSRTFIFIYYIFFFELHIQQVPLIPEFDRFRTQLSVTPDRFRIQLSVMPFLDSKFGPLPQAVQELVYGGEGVTKLFIIQAIKAIYTMLEDISSIVDQGTAKQTITSGSLCLHAFSVLLFVTFLATLVTHLTGWRRARR